MYEEEECNEDEEGMHVSCVHDSNVGTNAIKRLVCVGSPTPSFGRDGLALG